MKNSSNLNKEVSSIKIKVCGMGTPQNIIDVASLNPDYLGFIFYENSPRNFDKDIPPIHEKIKKTGVFVNATLEFILEKIKKYNFQAVQLHGEESADFCKALRIKHIELTSTSIEIIKVFSIKEVFDFKVLEEYEDQIDFFLFDTKGKNKGGNGYVFDWEILKNYPSNTPFFLSGGIDLDERVAIKDLLKYFKDQGKPHLLYAVDVNSKFEISPGNKDVERLQKFKTALLKN